MKRITIYDVAHEANVSLATVSRVINGVQIVREDTRKRVEAAIEKLGYKPNAIAQGLALQKTTSIALIVPEASFFYTGQIINGLIDVAKIYGYNIVLHTTADGIAQTEEVVETIIKSRVDGVVIFNDKLAQSEFDALNKYQVPIVVIGNKISGESICSVYVDYEKLIYDFVKEYLDRGITDIALVDDRKNPAAIASLKKGIKKAFKEHNLKFENHITFPVEYRSSYNYLKEYFKDHKHDLIITYRDSQAMATLNACRENGIDIPRDTELVCILDTKYNAMSRPRISGFKIPDYDLGAVAMRIMTKMLDNLNSDDKDKPVDYNSETQLSYIYAPRETTK